MEQNQNKVDWEKLGLLTDKELDEIDSNLRKVEEDGVQNILKYFDRIHDILSTFNNILIGGFFALSNFTNQIPKFTILVPIVNLGLLLFIEYRMMQKSRFEASIRQKNKPQIDAHGLSINRTNLYSLLAISSTAFVTIYFLYNLFIIDINHAKEQSTSSKMQSADKIDSVKTIRDTIKSTEYRRDSLVSDTLRAK